MVLLGRPYNVLSPEMSKGIPDIFGSLGVKTFFQDMVPYAPQDVRRIAPLLEMVHWLHAARILEVACVVADTPNLYPVFVTSFKCTPDSFAIEYFKRILDAKGKPYLDPAARRPRLHAGLRDADRGRRRFVPQPRERLGAATAAHARRAPARRFPSLPRAITRLGGRTLLCPNWDPLVNPLLAANLRREGVDARVLEEDPVVIRKAMRHNTGQCLPLNIIAQEAVDYVRRNTAWTRRRTAIWMPRSTLSCNIGMFTPFLKSLMEAEGGRHGADGDLRGRHVLPRDLAPRGGQLLQGLPRRRAPAARRAAGCGPTRSSPGATDAAIARAMAILVPAFEGKVRKDDGDPGRGRACSTPLIIFAGQRRPQVAIFGDLYVRDNDVMNQGLIRAIEEAGGEAITTPYTEYIRIIAESYFRKWALARRAPAVPDVSAPSGCWRTRWAAGAATTSPDSWIPSPPSPGTAASEFLRAFGMPHRAHGGVLREPPEDPPPGPGSPRPFALRPGEPRVLLSLDGDGGHGARHRAADGRARGQHHLRRHGAVPERR